NTSSFAYFLLRALMNNKVHAERHLKLPTSTITAKNTEKYSNEQDDAGHIAGKGRGAARWHAGKIAIGDLRHKGVVNGKKYGLVGRMVLLPACLAHSSDKAAISAQLIVNSVSHSSSSSEDGGSHSPLTLFFVAATGIAWHYGLGRDREDGGKKDVTGVNTYKYIKKEVAIRSVLEMSGLVNAAMDNSSEMESEDRIEKIVDIYITAEAVRDLKHTAKAGNTEKTTPQQTGSDHARSRADTVCLVMLCVLLLAAVIVLGVFINVNSTNYTQKKNELLKNIQNLTDEREKLLSMNINLTEENVDFITRNKNLTDDRDLLKSVNENLLNELKRKLQTADGWIYFQSSLYYMRNETKTWEASSRSCKESGADLIIINSEQEQDFLMNITRNEEFWIGLTDREVEGTWKWVNGDTMTTKFWATDEPNGGHNENCAVTYMKIHPDLIGWLDISCNKQYKWICEKKLLTMP
ncbi:hypothetical protein DNTS_006475, partial [Danionella cerebrum]